MTEPAEFFDSNDRSEDYWPDHLFGDGANGLVTAKRDVKLGGHALPATAVLRAIAGRTTTATTGTSGGTAARHARIAGYRLPGLRLALPQCLGIRA